MQVLSEVSQRTSTDEDPWEASDTYRILLCPACSDVVVERTSWHDGMEEEGDLIRETLYPSQKTSVRGLPRKVRQEFDAAAKVSAVSPNAHAVLLGRVLDAVCLDRKAKGDTLHKRLNDLAARGEIPQQLADLAHKLRQMRNVGAHGDLGDLTPREVPVLEAVCRAVLEYVYSAPLLLADVEESLGQLKSKK